MTLYPHQQQALADTLKFNRCAYYLDMGLGKTYVGSEKMMMLESRVNLIVCQKSKIQDWCEHIAGVCGFENVYDLTQSLDDYLHHVMLYAHPAVGVINYDLAWRRKNLLRLRDFTLMLDESSLVQNEKAKRTKFILKMQPENVILLSGTPSSGKYENLWSQARLLGWKISKKAFDETYINWITIDAGGCPIRTVNRANPYKNVERLKQKFREHGAVFMKTEDVMTLPQMNFVPVKVSTTKEYAKFQRTGVVEVQGQQLIGDTQLTKRLYSRMLCGHLNPAKLEAFTDLCVSTNDRLIVFYNFNDELNTLKAIAAELERPISEVNGQVKDLIAYENEDNSITLVQYQAGAMGLNLQKANKIIYFTLTDHPELFEQSKKRIHRIGQDRPCFYYLLLCRDSIEETEILPTLNLRKSYDDKLFQTDN